jgi:lipopolysaccharide/colanic/teichoic acid biosynthesis glycosyltransferase
MFSPFLLVISIFIKLSSKGPVFFRQNRIGYGGKEFTLLKFRSMHVNNDEAVHKEFTKNFINGNNADNQGAKDGVYKIKRDPRITKVGKFLRKTSLDELPQLFNVLKGDMSLVGPRPAIFYEVEEYDIWHKRRVLEVKPGITGVWQVKGRSKTTFDEMVRMDIQYIKRWSVLWDVMLILRTPFAVFMTEGAC